MLVTGCETGRAGGFEAVGERGQAGGYVGLGALVGGVEVGLGCMGDGVEGCAYVVEGGLDARIGGAHFGCGGG